MNTKITRRGFLQSAALGLAGLAIPPLSSFGSSDLAFDLGRVAIHSVSVHARPKDKSRIVRQRYRDELVNIYYEVHSPDGPAWNPLWYRVWGGYMHSAYLQRVKVQYNPVVTDISSRTGRLAEVTVPFTQSMRYLGYSKTWEPLYRLYYGSLHWVMGVDPGPDGSSWYRLRDELTEVEYHVQASHLRMVRAEAFAPISPDVDPAEKRIEVLLATQTLKAYEKDQVVFTTNVSTGIPNLNLGPDQVPTGTPQGESHIYSKMPSKHMGDGKLTADLEAYELPGVPWTSFFAPHGVAFHGTYWHNNFGIQMSHGCVNMRIDEAHWIYRWTTPVAPEGTWEKTGRGTLVIVS